MKRMSLVSGLLLTALVLALTTSAFAQSKDISPSIANQQHRIDKMTAKGRLTPGEAKTVQANLDHIKSVYERAIEHGTLGQEKGRIKGMLNENGRMISKKIAVRRL